MSFIEIGLFFALFLLKKPFNEKYEIRFVFFATKMPSCRVIILENR